MKPAETMSCFGASWIIKLVVVLKLEHVLQKSIQIR